MQIASSESPCVKGCGYDSVRQICRGCGRTLDEIAAWSTMSEAERQAVRAVLASRLAKPAN